MGTMIIHKSFLGHVKIDGIQIDDKIKELEIAAGTYDIVAGIDYDPNYHTDPYRCGRYYTMWGFHYKVKVDASSVCHVYVRRKFSLMDLIPIVKVKYKHK